MKLYTSPRSPFGRKVRVALVEKGLPFELVVVDLTRRDDAFFAMNPMGKIPVLETDGGYIPDSTVICEWLEDHFPTPPLYERDRLRCRVLDELGDSVGDHAVLAMQARNRGDEAGVAQHLARVDRLLAWAADRMARGDWPPGFTIADAALVSGLGYLTVRHGDGWRSRHPAIAAWADRLYERPSVRDSAPVG